MHGRCQKRGRSDGEMPPSVTQAWVRMTLKFVMIISRALQHRVQHHLRVPGPRGVLARQMIEMGDLLETVHLEMVVDQLSQVLQERSLAENYSRSSTPTEWSRVTSIPDLPRRRTPPRTASPTPTTSRKEKQPPTPDQRRASMWEVPPDLDMKREAPQCHCLQPAMLWISKTERNPDRLFWKCSRERTQQCSFFQWLMVQPLQQYKNPQIEYFTKRCQELCEHKRRDRRGTNGLNVKEKCLDCGKLLTDEKTPLGMLLQQEHQGRRAPTTPTSQGSQVSQRQLEKENKEFQEFLLWRQQNQQIAENQASSSREISRRADLFM